MGIAKDFARDAGIDPEDIGLSLAQRFARDAADGAAMQSEQSGDGDNSASVFGNAPESSFRNTMQPENQSGAEWARLSRMNGAATTPLGASATLDDTRATDLGDGIGGLAQATQTADSRPLRNASNQLADPPGPPQAVYGSVGSNASRRREESALYAGVGTALPRPFLGPGASTLPPGEGNSFNLNNLNTLLHGARRTLGLLRSPLLLPLMLSGDTDPYSNVGFIGPAYQKASGNLGLLNTGSTSALQSLGVNTQADYHTARSDVLDELARLNDSAGQIASVQRGHAPLLKAGWWNASKFVGSLDNGPRIEVYPADTSGNGPQMTVYPAGSRHASEYFITTPVIQNGKMALGTTYPALPPRGWKEFILTTPADSGLPPQHVMYSEGLDVSLSDLDRQLGIIEKQVVYNSAGQPVVRGWVSSQDGLLAIAEHRAGGSLDAFKQQKPYYWIAPDESVRIEWNTDGHSSSNEPPHVKIMRAIDGDIDNGWDTTEKYYIKGIDGYLKPTKF